jgi:hypothetical protein
LVQLAYRGDRGAIGVAYSRTFAPSGKADITGGTGSFLAAQPFGNNIATSSDSVGVQGFYRLAPRLQVHGWGVYGFGCSAQALTFNRKDILGLTNLVLDAKTQFLNVIASFETTIARNRVF